MGTTNNAISFRDVVCKKETPAALLCVIDGEEHWIPKSQVDDESEVFDDQDNKEGTLVISEWIATQKGLV